MVEVAAPERLAPEAPARMLLADLNAEHEKRAARMAWLFEKGGTHFDISEAEAGEIRELNAELDRLTTARAQLDEYQRMRAKAHTALAEQRTPQAALILPGARPDPRDGGASTPIKSLGQSFVEAENYKATQGLGRRVVHVEVADVDIKTLMTLTTGFAPPATRGPKVVLTALRRPVVADLIPSDPTTDTATRYMEETTFTNNAAPVAEGAVKPEAALAYTERMVPIEVIAVTLPVTLQQLADVPQIRGLIDNRLTVMLQLTEENQLLSGTGTSPQLTGILTRSGLQTQAKGADPTPTAIYLAMTKVRATAFAEPTGVVIHPNDWAQIRTLTTTDGIYIWGPPSEAGPETIWGKPAVITTAIAEGTALTGDFALFAHISRRMGITIDASTEHSDFFVRNQAMLRAEERLSLEVYRPSAFCSITGI